MHRRRLARTERAPRPRTRREFLGEVGRGMLTAGVGASLAAELGLAPARLWAEEPAQLSFGRFAPLVDTMLRTPVDELQPALVRALSAGASRADLIAAGALANARAFGGEDYEGYHVMMALVPALEMAEQLPERERALPVLKVLYRNTARLDAAGRREHAILAPVHTAEGSAAAAAAELRALTRAGETERAERALARIVRDDPEGANDALQPIVHDDFEVHRVVLAWRAFDVLRLTGSEHAETLLRQTVRFCVKGEDAGRTAELRALLPELLEGLAGSGRLGGPLGTKSGDDAWIGELAALIHRGSRAEAARAVAAALAEGYAPGSIGEALSIASTRLLLHDPGQKRAQSYGRDAGSVHGASVGVHASDSAHAWRAIAAASSPKNAAASLIVGAYHTAGQARHVGAQPIDWASRVEDEDKARDEASLLDRLDDAIRARDQLRACALASEYLSRGGAAAEPLFVRLLAFATSEDGALHAEKYFRTVQTAVETGRRAFRDEHLIALARVTASECGTPAPGREQARALLGV